MKIKLKQTKLVKKNAKVLRDSIVKTIENWSNEFSKLSSLDDNVSNEDINIVREHILKYAYSGLIWRIIEKDDRYNIPYYSSILIKLKEQYPDLVVENKVGCFVSVPVFKSSDVERMFSNGNKRKIKCIEFEDKEKKNV